MTTEIRYKASNKTTIANAYNISLYTLQKWLEPIKMDLGNYCGKIYSPKQVSKIVEHLGLPEHLKLISV
ncbi:hypothetical protein ACSTS3_10405 [Aquimarina muelleri]|uniref:hypothetical protein n=1 Tax=Aquimarina muelleri TaxID=279356 RepID=UPI003F682643